MTAIALPITPPPMHTKDNAECPFCPGVKEQEYKTYSGKDNKSGQLINWMARPASIVQENARPLFSIPNVQLEPQPKVCRTHSGDLYNPGDPTIVWNNHEAHHAISGKQCMQDHDIEKFILKEHGEIKADTGYSINNPNNGIWLPSWPKSKGEWPGVSQSGKCESIAFAAMTAYSRQWHLGNHSVGDKNDPDQKMHKKYDAYIKEHLDELCKNVTLWAANCPCCNPDSGKPPQKPFPPPYRVNRMLDRLSMEIKEYLSGDPSKWYFFTSKLVSCNLKVLNNIGWRPYMLHANRGTPCQTDQPNGR